MVFTLGELASLVDGELYGPSERPIERVAPVGQAGPKHLSYLSKQSALRSVRTPAPAVLIKSDLLDDVRMAEIDAIVVADPASAMQTIAHKICPIVEFDHAGIDPRAAVHPDAQVASGVSIGPFAVVGAGARIGPHTVVHAHAVVGEQSVIGQDCVLYPHVVLYPRTVLGDRCLVHAGVVLGADGFGYRRQNGQHVKVHQFGQVVLGDDVEVGANSTVDRATYGATNVGSGTKIDDLVMVGHNCQVGEHNILVALSGLSGSCELGSFVTLAGQVGVADHVKIGNEAIVLAQSGVMRDVGPGEHVMGSPARPDRQFMREMSALFRLPKMRQELAEVRRALKLDEPVAGSDGVDRAKVA